MNFDQFNPLSQYLPGGISNNFKHDFEADDSGIGIGDWGIEETISNPRSLIYSNHKPSSPLVNELNNSSTLLHEDLVTKDFGFYYNKYNSNPIPPTTENFSKYIKKYLRLNLNKQFWERFKYSLIISNLLDDSMILSKNDQALNNLIDNDRPVYKRFIKFLNHDGTELLIMNQSFKLKFPNNLYYKNQLLLIINLIIFLLKQNLIQKQDNISYSNKVKMFKVLLIASTKLIQFKRVNTIIQMSKSLTYLNQFLIENFKINKRLILSLMSIRELQLFQFMKKSPDVSGDQNHLHQLKYHLNGSVDFLIFNLRTCIVKLLPLLNGCIFEKYCNINNIDIFSINTDETNLEYGDSIDNSEDDIKRIVDKINIFNKLRKFLICELLTIDEKIEKNFYLLKIFDQFNLNEWELEVNQLKNSSNFEKLLVMEEFFIDHNKVVSSFNLLFENFEKLYRIKGIDAKDEDILKPRKVETPFDNSNLNQLISKMSNLTTNLKFFQKYNQSTIDIQNSDENNEKLFIFNQFNEEINTIRQLYQLNLLDLNDQLTENQLDQQWEPFSNPSSQRNSRTSGEFNLKSFHTLNPNNVKKRYSLPSKHLGTDSKDSLVASESVGASNDKLPITNESNTQDSNSEPTEKHNSSYKRLSTGLKLGLLTVFEDENKPNYQRKTSMNKPAFDDNYINILPPTNYFNDSYNQATFDSLSRRRRSQRNSSGHNNRMSSNSINSNVSGLSDLLTSTQVTSFDDIDENSNNMSKDDLREKLEESLNRIYNLESQMKSRSSETNNSMSTVGHFNNDNVNNNNDNANGNGDVNDNNDYNNNELTDINEVNEFNDSTINKSFLNTLENTLNK